jgi:hypothetical protein
MNEKRENEKMIDNVGSKKQHPMRKMQLFRIILDLFEKSHEGARPISPD